jgi:hypothetical protein
VIARRNHGGAPRSRTPTIGRGDDGVTLSPLYSAACYSLFMNPPTKSIKITIPHRVSRQQATQRLQSGFADFRKQYASNLAQMEDRWTGDHMDFKATAFGQPITGRIDVRDSSVEVEVDLPWLFAVLAEKIQGQLQQAGQKLLEKK